MPALLQDEAQGIDAQGIDAPQQEETPSAGNRADVEDFATRADCEGLASGAKTNLPFQRRAMQ